MSNAINETGQQGMVQFFLTAGCDGVGHAIRKSLLAAAWFVFLTFPIMVIKVNTIEKTVAWRWENMAYIAVSIFFGSFVWRWLLARKELKKDESKRPSATVDTGMNRLAGIAVLRGKDN